MGSFLQLGLSQYLLWYQAGLAWLLPSWIMGTYAFKVRATDQSVLVGKALEATNIFNMDPGLFQEVSFFFSKL